MISLCAHDHLRGDAFQDGWNSRWESCTCRLERLFEGPIDCNGCRVGQDRARVVGRLISSGKDERKVKGGANGKEKDREKRGPVILNDNDRVRDIRRLD